MKAGNGMSDDFVIHVGMDSHARLVSEWAHYKSLAQIAQEDLEANRRTLDALRTGLRQVLGVPDGVRLSDAELMIQLGYALNEEDTDRHLAVLSRPGVRRAQVAYSEHEDGQPSLVVGLPPEMAEKVKSWPSFSIDIEPLPGERMGDTLGRGLRQAPIVSVPAPPGTPIASYEDFPTRAPDEGPWLAPPPYVPHCSEPVGENFCGARLTDGACPQHGPVAQREQDGPATESMPAVEEPPQVADGYAIGRLFVRDDTVPDDVLGLVTRLGDVWLGSVRDNRPLQFWNDQADTWRTAADLLLMHGMLWELLHAPSEVEQAEEVSGE